MKPNKLAVDIVLIPPAEIIKLAVDITRACPESAEDDYVLDTQDSLPHLTLLLGKVSRDSLPEVGRTLEDAGRKFGPLDLEITEINDLTKHDVGIERKKERREFLVAKTEELVNLHKTVLSCMKPFLLPGPAEPEMFINPESISRSVLGWVETFATLTAGKNFRPHISFGPAKPDDLIFPIKFTASRLALCHLGPHCTCRKVLWSTTLS